MGNDHNSERRTCTRCGTELQLDVAGGNCPNCLMHQAVFGTDSEQAPKGRWQPPSLEAVQIAFPHLELMELVGSGGMGAVYKAKQKSLGRIVALKILAPHYADNSDFAERFAREAKVLAEVTHPHIVAVHDFGFAAPFYYLLMEFVDGVNLRQAMNAAKLTPEQALKIVPPICEALQFAHQRGIVHRDIKPENLLLDKFGTIKLVDFGIARLLKDPSARDSSKGQSDSNEPGQVDSQSHATQLTGASVIGTPNYMAPEQRTDPKRVDQRADIYSLGVVLYEMLTGELPGSRWVPPSKKVQIDVRLDEVVLRALDIKPDHRYSTASEFQHSVESISTTIVHSAQPSTFGLQAIAHTSRCLVTSQAGLSTFLGQFFLWTRKGRLTLTDSQFQLTYGTSVTVIPLESIQSVSLGLIPASVNPVGLIFIEIEYLLNDKKGALYFVPNDRMMGTPSSFNLQTYQWWELIRQRVVSRTGKAPEIRAAREILNQRVQLSSKIALAIFILIWLTPYFFMHVADRSMTNAAPNGGWAMFGPAVFIIGIVLAVLIIWFYYRSSNNPDAPDFHEKMALRNAGMTRENVVYYISLLLLAIIFGGGLIALTASRPPAKASPPQLAPSQGKL